jgi:exodeoxyribonuclease III
MRLISWNVNSIRARLPRVLELLDQHHPDVVCLQETKVLGDAFPHAACAELGYRAIDHSEGRWNGVALLVPDPAQLLDPQLGLPSEPDEVEARWVEATIDGIRVVSVYVPNGREPSHPMFEAKLRFLEAARDRLAELVARGPTIIAGDFNVALEDRDVWDIAAFVDATHVTPDERSRLAALLDLGLTDAYREVGPDDEGFTWWDYRMGAFRRGMGMRIDYALSSHHLEVRSAAVDTTFRRNNEQGDKPSDHAPLVVEYASR